MRYHSTRNDQQFYSSAEALLKGLADDGGLFVPEEIPTIDFESWHSDSYQSIAKKIYTIFFDDLENDIDEIVASSYGDNFDDSQIVPTHWLDEKTGLIELWHGPTLAFKDLALQCLPHLMKAAKKLLQDQHRILILTATSGDTGKAAMEGFANVEDFEVLVFYPYQGVSSFQKKQMLCPGGDNVRAIAVKGNFDDCQRAVKAIFSDEKLHAEVENHQYQLSSANSINIGRLIPQMNYYIYSYLQCVQSGKIQYGERINVTVPTGNFGNILAACYTKEMGLPIGQIILAANPNHVLADFLQTGAYDANRELLKTSSPSMDILVASNLERYLYLKNPDCNFIHKIMLAMKENGKFHVEPEMMDILAGWADEEQTGKAISEVFNKYAYIMDPHTAVAYAVAQKINHQQLNLIASTASPYKFSEKVLSSLNQTVCKDDWQSLQKISTLWQSEMPTVILKLYERVEQEELIANQADLLALVLDWIKA